MSKPTTNTVVVNFFAGPGAGKSTSAAHLFAMLKWDDIECEMVREFAKELVWSECTAQLNDQIFVFAEQLHRQIVLEDKVPVIITDSPLLLSILYDDANNQAMRALILQQFGRNHNINIYLRRRKRYNKNGRMQTHEQAIEKDNQLRAILDENAVEYTELDGSPESIATIVELVKAKLYELNNQ